MSETTTQDLGSVSEKLLFALYIRALESQRLDALLKDEKAITLVTQIGDDLNEWSFLDPAEPRVDATRWLRPIKSLFRTIRTCHFRLGKSAE